MFYRLAVKINCEAIALITNATLVLIGIENDTQHTMRKPPPEVVSSRQHGYRKRYPAVGGIDSSEEIGIEK